MKRPVLHIIFWMVYLAQDTFLHYSWLISSLVNISDTMLIWVSVQTAVVAVLPKLAIVYFFLNYLLPRFYRDDVNRLLLYVQVFIATAITVLWYRASFYYLVQPYIYRGYLPPGFKTELLSARSVLSSILEVGYIAGLAIIIKLIRQQGQSRVREQLLVKEKLQTELKYLKNQTNPHFLFNTLNNIHILARKKSDRTADVVMKLSEILSFMLYESGKETVAISEEIRMLADYIELEKIRYNERLSVIMETDIDNGSQPITPLILLPLLENAFKHGVGESRFDAYIKINIQLKSEILYYDIRNSVETWPEVRNKSRIGLGNLKRQLELMYKEYNLNVTEHDKEFSVTISIDLRSYGKL